MIVFSYIGNSSVEAVYDDGQIKFEFHGESCKEGVAASTVVVLLLCDHEANRPPEMFPEVRINVC